jgi:hypothetical protein
MSFHSVPKSLKTSFALVGPRHYAAILLLSLATLLLELSLTRVLSVALWYHFGFLIISTALLGFGSAGVVVAMWRRLREEISLDKALSALATLFGLTTIICFWLMQRIPFDPFSLLANRWQLLYMPLYYVLISIPFFCSGLALAVLFTRGPRQVNRLYAADLLGAGLGCAIVALVMPAFGGSGSVVIAAALGLLSAVVFGMRQSRSIAIAAAVFCVVAFISAFGAGRFLKISVTPNKVAPVQPPIYTAWNTFSRIDVFERPPNTETKAPGVRRFIFDAGTAATGIRDLRPDVRDYLKNHTADAGYPSGIAYADKQQPKILIIGSGGGEQVLDALHFHARDITAVEINPIINDVVSRRMRDYWGNLFNQPEVHLITEEGRSSVRRSREQYDAIISVHTISNAAIMSGALSLAENYTLTREAFEDYLDHLTPDGVLYFTRPEAQIPRLVATAREVFAARGIKDPSWHLFAYRERPTRLEGPDRSSLVAGFLLKKSQFTPENLRRIEQMLQAQLPESNAPPPEILYSPLEPHADIYRELVTATDLRAVYASQPSQIEPATDDRPFFNHHTRWSSLNLATIRELFIQQRQSRLALEDRPVAEITLLVLLAQSIVIAGVLILLPLARFSRAGLRAVYCWRLLLYFAGLGFGFIMIEISLLQRYTLFLGQPVYTFAVVLASLLIFTGVGAALSDKFSLAPRRSLTLIVPLIVIVLGMLAFLSPVVFSVGLGWSLFGRVLVSIVTLAPLGVLLGMPFPIGLRIISEQARSLVAWAWGVNGFFTVIGTIVSQMMGMAFGFKLVLLIAALTYVLALPAIWEASRAAEMKSGFENDTC